MTGGGAGVGQVLCSSEHNFSSEESDRGGRLMQGILTEVIIQRERLISAGRIAGGDCQKDSSVPGSITVEQFAPLSRQGGFDLIDVRTPNEFYEVHAVGALMMGSIRPRLWNLGKNAATSPCMSSVVPDPAQPRPVLRSSEPDFPMWSTSRAVHLPGLQPDCL